MGVVEGDLRVKSSKIWISGSVGKLLMGLGVLW